MHLTRRSAAWAGFAATLPIYLLTMNRTIGFIDRGELAAVAWTLWSYRLRLWTGRTDAYLGMVTWMYGEHRLERARYEAGHGRMELAHRTLASAADFDPKIRPGQVGTLPLAGQEIVEESARFYARLRSTLAVAATEP